MQQRRNEEVGELSMTPMIDVVFLLLVFFLVNSQPQKPEADLGLRLPGTVAQEEAIEIPDEQRIAIEAGGRIVLNEQPIAEPADRRLGELLVTLRRFKASTEANGSEALVTLAPEDDVPHQRIADVMNICAQAEIDGVTFAGAEEAPF